MLVPPLVTKGAIKSRRPMTKLRLPTQAGKVSKIVTTNLVSNSPGWIAKGDKYYSLCVPNRRMVACAPIVATSVMQDIEVGALAGPKGEPLLTFKIAQGTKQAPKRLVYAINYFLTRTNKQVAHFNRKAVSYAPIPGAKSVRVGATSNYADAGGAGGGCSYDDFGGYDCSGGDSGGGDYGGGYDGGGGYGDSGGDEDPVPDPGSAPDEPTCTGNCEYPSGNNNGDPDPCVGPNGEPICPVVEVPGARPDPVEPMGLPTCQPTSPFTIQCGSIPPVVGGVPDIPTGPTPYFPQAMCNLLPMFCSAGQVPDNDRAADSDHSGKTLDQLYDICDSINAVEMGVCETTLKLGYLDYPGFKACGQRATERLFACRQTARQVTDNGAHTAP